MLAAVFYGPGDIRVEERPRPALQTDSVLIAVKLSSLCGTDYHIFEGNFPVEAPLVLGHDFAGVIEEAGADVTLFKPGDRVTAEPIRYCGRCRLCLGGKYTVCERRAIMGMHIDGSLAEFVVVPEKNVFAIPERVTFDQAALVEALAVGLHSMDYARPLPGEDVLILGQGALGLVHTQIAKLMGTRVIVTEVSPVRRTLAGRFGADVVIDPEEMDLSTSVHEHAPGGADVVIDTTGSPRSVEYAPHLSKIGGRLLLVGSSGELMAHGPASEVILSKELTVYGVAGGPAKYPVALDLLATGKVDVDALVTHRWDLAEIGDALRAPAHEPGLIKSLIATGGRQ